MEGERAVYEFSYDCAHAVACHCRCHLIPFSLCSRDDSESQRDLQSELVDG